MHASQKVLIALLYTEINFESLIILPVHGEKNEQSPIFVAFCSREL